ncbi:MAG: hypothetical protein QGD94_09985, partial [Planctomycetia bacterium]|nr:hypothetical protein [Planctomycetia bacterium]
MGRKISISRTGRWPAGLFPAAVCLLCAMSFSCPRAQAAKVYGDLALSAEPAPAGQSTHGYAEYRISITNRSPKLAHKVTLAMPAEAGDSQLKRVTRTVTVAPGSTVWVSLLQPPLGMGYGGVRVIIDGSWQREALRLTVAEHSGPQSCYEYVCVLTSRSVPGDFQTRVERVLAGSSTTSPYAPDKYDIARAELPTSSWSTNWLAYSRYDGIVVTGGDLRTMPPQVRTALMRYVECGGSLLVIGPWDVPEEWKTAATAGENAKIYLVGFGECIVNPSADLARWNQRLLKRIRDSWLKTASPWRESHTVEGANSIFPVVENLQIPVRGLLILMLSFAVAIGPVNLFVLSRKKKRIWMLWTVPAISLLTCIAVFTYATIAEGWAGHFRTESLTILDEVNNRATTIGWTAFYSPLTPGGGLHFEYETELTPLERDDSFGYRRSPTRSRTVDWTTDQHLASGWLSARVPAHFKVRKSQPRRERLVVRKERDGSLVAVNGLGAVIEEVWVADKEGRMYYATDVAPGAQTVLQKSSKRARGSADGLRNVYGSRWTNAPTAFVNRPQDHLLPGCYIASLNASPFIEQGLAGAKVTK